MAAATLTWHVSALGTKTGTAIGNFFADFNTLITSNSGDANFKWVVASANTGSTPYTIVLKRKDASAGRILLVSWSSAPAANNVAILDTSPTTTQTYVAWFPAGNVDSPSNLTAASGTILGDDTGAVKCASIGSLASFYAASFQPFYAENEEGVLFCTGHAGALTTYFAGAGNLVVNMSDTEYGCTIGGGGTTLDNFSTSTSTVLAWTATAVLAGATTTHVRTNYGVENTAYFIALRANAWGAEAQGATDIRSYSATNSVWFIPVMLASQIKGGGFPLKLRQIGWGPPTINAFQAYNTTGPVTAAIQLCAATAGQNSGCWVTNFEI